MVLRSLALVFVLTSIAAADPIPILQCDKGQHSSAGTVAVEITDGQVTAVHWKVDEDGGRSDHPVSVIRGAKSWLLGWPSGDDPVPENDGAALVVIEQSLAIINQQMLVECHLLPGAAKILDTAAGPPAISCAKAEVDKGGYLGRLREEGDGASPSLALNLCREHSRTVGALTRFQNALTALVLQRWHHASSTSVHGGLGALVAHATAIRRHCKAALDEVNTCHNLHCVFAAEKIEATCARGTARLLEEASTSKTSP